MGEFKRLNILTVYSRFFLVILGLLQNTIAEDYLEGAIDGEEYLKQIINGDQKPKKPGLILFTAPYKLCKGPACTESDHALAFPLFVGKKGKDVYQKLYARDHSVIHNGKPHAPFRHSTTKATTTTTTTEIPTSPQCMNVNVDLDFIAKTNEEKETVTCPTLPETTTTEKQTTEPTTMEPTTEKHTTEAMTTTTEATTRTPEKSSIEESTEEAVMQNEEITTTACPTAPTCEEEEITMTCPTVTGCIKRKSLKHTLPLKSTTSSYTFTGQHTANTKNKPVGNSPEEMSYEDAVTGPQPTSLRHFLRNNYATTATTPINTFKDYYYYYYLLK